MLIRFEDRLSDSPYVERVWRSSSGSAGSFLSVAANHFEMVVSRHRGKRSLTLRGPEGKATAAECPAEGEWVAVRFKLGTFMPQCTPGEIRDRRDATLPNATCRSFWLDGSAWEFPSFENAESFVAKLARKGLLLRDSTVETAMRGEASNMPARTVQRHFKRATGLAYAEVRQIERARYATNLLRQGTSILDAVHEADYYDQAHMTRALKYRVGLTPREIIQGTQQLSFLYKTNSKP